MNTTAAIKFCFTSETYEATKKYLSPPELLKLACLIAFRNEYQKFPITSFHWQVAEQLKKALTILDNSGIFKE